MIKLFLLVLKRPVQNTSRAHDVDEPCDDSREGETD